MADRPAEGVSEALEVVCARIRGGEGIVEGECIFPEGRVGERGCSAAGCVCDGAFVVVGGVVVLDAGRRREVLQHGTEVVEDVCCGWWGGLRSVCGIEWLGCLLVEVMVGRTSYFMKDYSQLEVCSHVSNL